MSGLRLLRVAVLLIVLSIILSLSNSNPLSRDLYAREKANVATQSNQISIRSRQSGVVEKIFFQPGDIVIPAQLVARLKYLDYVNDLQNLQTRLAREKDPVLSRSIQNSIKEQYNKIQFSHIRSPMFGIISSIEVEKGVEIQKNQILFTITPLDQDLLSYIQNLLKISPILIAGEGGKVSDPTLKVRVPPEYPEEALKARLNGKVDLQAVIDTNGNTVWVRTLAVSPEGFGFEENAHEVVKKWKFEPTINNGETVAVLVKFSVEFNVVY